MQLYLLWIKLRIVERQSSLNILDVDNLKKIKRTTTRAIPNPNILPKDCSGQAVIIVNNNS